MKEKKERFIVSESLPWKLICIAIFVIAPTGYSYYIIENTPIGSNIALARLAFGHQKLIFEGYLLAVIGAMCILFIIGLHMLIKSGKDDRTSQSSELN